MEPIQPQLHGGTGRRLAPFGLVLLLAGLAPAAGQAPPDPRQPGLEPARRLEVLLERVRFEHERIENLEADFVQRKESQLLLEPAEARGTFTYAAPDRVRWEYSAPDPISLLVAGDEMITWYRDINQVEKMQIGRKTEKVLQYLGAGSSMETLLRYFDARLATPGDPESPYRIELTPRYERIARRLESMTLWLAADSFMPVGLHYVEADGDVTEYRFTNLRLNRSLPADRFDLDLPADVEVRQVDVDRRASLR